MDWFGEREAAIGPAALDLGDLLLLRQSGLFDEKWFLNRHSDLAAESVDALTHFHRWGWKEGRWPNPYFDTAYYLGRYDDVRDAGMDPLFHYACWGEAEGRRPIAWFDPAWYRGWHAVPAGELCLSHFLRLRKTGLVSPIKEFDAAHYLRSYPDVALAGMDPFEHYMIQGWKEDREPHPGFDGVFYRARYLRNQPDEIPLLHYLRHRGDADLPATRPVAGTTVAREVRRNVERDAFFEEAVPLPEGAVRLARVLAFYLPQFHPIPENDQWWGRGFTEWTNVARALPRFAGHYQPRIPRDLGHYRLEGTTTLREQVRLARGAGIEGFIWYFYAFNGRRLLEAPLEAMLADPSVEFPFSLMWANENWTRRWDGAEEDVLIAQDYRPEDEAGLVASFARYFKDPRYIRVQGRPLLMLYRGGNVPSAAATFARWRRLFRERHGEDPLLVMAQTFGDRDPRAHGLDGAVEFPPHKLGEVLNEIPVELLDPDFSGKVHAYDDAADHSCTEPTPLFPLIKTCVPSWDNDARRQGAGTVLHGASPQRYQAWLAHLIEHARANPFPDSRHGEPIVCINAWNEWAEGAYLEPDLRYGGAFLNATGRAVAGLQPQAREGALLLVGHDAFPAGSQHLLLHLGRQLRAAHGVAVQFLLLGGGRLLKHYQEAAPTVLAGDDAALARQAAAAFARGTRAAIINSAAAAHACPVLRAAGIVPTLLAHELPGLLRTRGLVEGARVGVEAAERVVFASTEGRDRFGAAVPLPRGRPAVLPQGLYAPARRTEEAEGLRAQLGIAEQAKLALAVGFGDMRKGFDLALKAWGLAQANGGEDGLHLLWVGDLDTNTRALFGDELASARASGRFHHLPFRADAADLFTAADVHLLASREDPYPSVVLEAMSAGVPTVAFEGSGGAPSLLREMEGGIAVPMEDTAAMARHLVRLAWQGPPGGRARLAAAARRRFDFGDYAARLLALAMPGLARVSACIPSRDYARYMAARLGSVLGQTYPVAEVIVLDDASSDGSAAVAREVAARAGRRIQVVESRHSSGSVFKQWARAARLARGEWLWIAEADDECRPEMLARLVAASRAAPGTVLAFCDSRAVNADGALLWPDHKAYYAELGVGALTTDLVLPGREFLGRYMAERNVILNASAVLLRREAFVAALDRCGRDLESYQVAGDWRLYAEMMLDGGSVAYVAEPLNTHRRHAASATSRLDSALHVDEIARVQAWIAARVNASVDDPLLPAQQRGYRERVARQLAEAGGVR